MKYQTIQQISREIQLLLSQGANRLNILDPNSTSHASPELASYQFDAFKEIIRDNRALLNGKEGIALIPMLPEDWRLFYARQLLRADDSSHAYQPLEISDLEQIIKDFNDLESREIIQDFKQRVPLINDEIQKAKTHENIWIQTIFQDNETPSFHAQQNDDEIFDALQIQLTEPAYRYPEMLESIINDQLTELSKRQINDLNLPFSFNRLEQCEFILNLVFKPHQLNTPSDIEMSGNKLNPYEKKPWAPNSNLLWLAERAGYLLCIEISFLSPQLRYKFAFEHLKTLFWISPNFLNQTLSLLPSEDRDKLLYHYLEMNEELATITDEKHLLQIVKCVHQLPTTELRRLAMELLKDKLIEFNWESFERGEPNATMTEISDIILLQFCVTQAHRNKVAENNLKQAIETNKRLKTEILAQTHATKQHTYHLCQDDIKNFFASLMIIPEAVAFINQFFHFEKLDGLFTSLCQQLQLSPMAVGYPQVSAFFQYARDKQMKFINEINAYGEVLSLLRQEEETSNQLSSGSLSWMISKFSKVLVEYNEHFSSGSMTFNIEHLQNISAHHLEILLDTLSNLQQKTALLDQIYTNLCAWKIEPIQRFEILMPILRLPVSQNPDDPIHRLVQKFMLRFQEIETQPFDWNKTNAQGELIIQTCNANQLAWAIYLLPPAQRLSFAQNLLKPIYNEINKPARQIEESILPFILHALKVSNSKEQIDAYIVQFNEYIKDASKKEASRPREALFNSI